MSPPISSRGSTNNVVIPARAAATAAAMPAGDPPTTSTCTWAGIGRPACAVSGAHESANTNESAASNASDVRIDTRLTVVLVCERYTVPTAFRPPRAYFGYAHLGTLQSGSIAELHPAAKAYNDVGPRQNSQRCGEEDRVMEDRTGFMAGLIVGAMIGLGLGIMLAPRAGQETRDQLKEKAQEVTERLKSTAADVKGRVRESAGDVASKVREKIDKDDILNRLGRDG
ncbi:MAG: YtxH domain-containing protein [Bacillati bacterium ANGP1]|uniref:YtxH domain-containing protein n=1 Tax=Candidatus Segetimicrobium genomatis TaxID=2569760 RepID=A0A537ISY8_9BACT|nr:MAG: YtxH domain-containing protein [Terrabacteria group bacterium ANGP1]